MSTREEKLQTLRMQIEAIKQSTNSGFFTNSTNVNLLEREDLSAQTQETQGGLQFNASGAGKDELAFDTASDKPRIDAYTKIVGLINASEKSEHEIRKRLKQSSYTEEEINDALERATSCGLVDDDRFATILIQSRIHQGWGSEGIERELLKHHIDPFAVEGWPHEYPLSRDEQFERAIEMLTRKPPHSKNLRESAYRKLRQKGYSSSVASQAARIWTEQIVYN